MKYKVIVLDLDGTLLNTQSEIIDENKKILQKCMKNGIEIVLASGRILDSVISFSSEIGDLNYAISSNGAVIYDLKKEKIIYENNIEKEKVLQIIKICEENSIYYSLYTLDGIIAKDINHNVLFYQNENIIKPVEKRVSINIVNDVYEYIQNNENEKILKISICDNDKIIFNRIMNKLREVEEVDVLEVAHISRKTIRADENYIPVEYYYTEITNKNIDKWEAVKKLLNIYGYSEGQTICIGDNINDEKMIKNSGIGIAMGNSDPIIKNIAKMIITDNDTDGISQVLETIIGTM